MSYCLCFQFRIRASDQRSPVEQKAEASVRIAISRDERPPEFLAEPYHALISENLAVNETVTRVVASDNDLQVRYLQLYFENFGVKFIILRTFNTYFKLGGLIIFTNKLTLILIKHM